MNADIPRNPDDPDADTEQMNIPERRNDRLSSSAIPYADYDPESQTMTVTFVNGQTYSHQGVTWEEYLEFISSSSPGRTWHAQFKGR